MSTLRLFTAVDLPPALRRALDAYAMERLLRDPVGRRSRRLRGLSLVPPDNLHITVRFLGDVEEQRVAEITEALRAGVAPVSPGSARIEGLGAFPTPRRPSVVWCGATAEDATEEAPGGVLARLERAVTAALAPLGFPPEDRAYHPHVTVARIREGRTRRVIAERLAEIDEADAQDMSDAPSRPRPLSLGTVRVEHLTLLSSSARRSDANPPSAAEQRESTPRGHVRYETLARLPLAAAPPGASSPGSPSSGSPSREAPIRRAP